MPEARFPIITLTTDFGLTDHYVSAVKAAILAVSTQIAIVDITHDVPAHDVRSAAWILRSAFASFPRSTVHLAVADPGVGTARRPIVAVTENYYFVGPDNGIFSFVFEVEPPIKAMEITAAHYVSATISPTFHARDVFAPAAAHLARGANASHFGEIVDGLTRLDLPRPKVAPDGSIKAVVTHIDRFGNVILNVTRQAMEALLERTRSSGFTARAGAARITQTFRTYGEATGPEPFLLFNSVDYLEIAANRARASDLLGLKVGGVVDLALTQRAAQ